MSDGAVNPCTCDTDGRCLAHSEDTPCDRCGVTPCHTVFRDMALCDGCAKKHYWCPSPDGSRCPRCGWEAVQVGVCAQYRHVDRGLHSRREPPCTRPA